MEPYVGEIRMFGGDFAPDGWMFCDGQMLSTKEYAALFALIGYAYGGDGKSTFALPDLRGRIPIHKGNEFKLARSGGENEIRLTVDQTPSHGHPWMASSETGTNQTPGEGMTLASSQASVYFNLPDALDPLAPASVDTTGKGQPHSNLQPYLCVSFIIAFDGIYPRNVNESAKEQLYKGV